MRKKLEPSKLPEHIRRDIEAFIRDNNLRGISVEHLSTYEALDYFLKWNGIINWTSQILDAVRAIDKAEIPEAQQIIHRA